MAKGKDQPGRAAFERLVAWRERGHAEGVGPADAALSALTDIGTLRRMLDEAEFDAVRSARGGRRSWAEIATRLGVTRQAAWERWRDVDENLPPSGPLPSELPLDVKERAARELAAEVMRDSGAEDAGDDADESAAPEPPGRRGRWGRSAAPKTVRVPSAVGRPWDEARDLMKREGFEPVFVSHGDLPGAPLREVEPEAGTTVTAQAPEAGARVVPGSTVRMWVGRGGGSAGVREPRRPFPASPPERAMEPEPTTGPAVGPGAGMEPEPVG